MSDSKISGQRVSRSPGVSELYPVSVAPKPASKPPMRPVGGMEAWNKNVEANMNRMSADEDFRRIVAQKLS